MRIITIHRLGDNKDFTLFRLLEKEFTNVFHIDYSDCYAENVMKKIKEKVLSYKFSEEHILIGHSLGGLLAFYLQNEYTKAIISLAPALKLKKEVELALLLELAVKKEFIFEGRHPVKIHLDDYKFLKELMKNVPLPKQKTFIIIGEYDYIIDKKYVYRFFKKYIKDGYFIEIKGTGHLFRNKEKEVIELIKSIINLFI